MHSRWVRLLYLICPLFVITLVFALRPEQTTMAQEGLNPACEMKLGPWQTGANIPFNHIEGATAVVNGKLYIFAGFKDSSLNVSNRVDVYNVATNTWETATKQRRPMPTSISHVQPVVDGKWVWLAGGYVGANPGDVTVKVWKYDTVEDLWYAGPSLPKARSAGTFAIVGRNLHYIGGLVNRDDSSADHWILNLDNQGAGWKPAPAMPNKRNQGGAVAINGVIYFVGGQYKHDHDPIDLKLVHAFNTATNTWSQKANLAIGRSHFEPGTTKVEDRIVIVGGRANQNKKFQLKQVTTYNPATNTWKELTPLPVALIAPNAAYVNGKLIVTAGGTKYNAASKKTYISEVSWTNCNQPTNTPVPPTATPTNTPQPATPTHQPTSTPIAPLTLLSPLDREMVRSSSSRFSWTRLPGATGYTVQITGVTKPFRFKQSFSDLTNLCSGDICSTELDFSSASLPDEARLEWRVIAQTGYSSIQSSTQMFFTSFATTGLIEPVNGAVLTDNNVTFRWNAIPNAQDYKLVIRRAGKAREIVNTRLNSTTRTPVCASSVCEMRLSNLPQLRELRSNRAYEWLIVAYTPEGKVRSEVHTFVYGGQGELLSLPTSPNGRRN
jgi:N-acetylneuraminic acid mutarotase